VFDHRRQRGRFAATGRTRHEHDAAGRFRDGFQLRQQAEFLEGRHHRFDEAHGKAPLPALLEQIGPETADAGQEVGEVNLAFLVQFAAQMGRGHLLDNRVHPLRVG